MTSTFRTIPPGRDPILLGIVGPTASGKEDAALHVARTIGAEIISMDSMKLYRGMDIGTAKPSREVRSEIPHHMVDVAEAGETFDMKRYVEGVERLLPEIRGRGRWPLLSGGTAMYLQGILFGLFDGPGKDPELRRRLAEEGARLGAAALHARLAAVDPAAAVRIHPNDLRRIVRALEVFAKTGQPISSLQREFGRPRPRHDAILAGIRRDRADLHARIDRRVERMVASDLVGEVERLRCRGALRGAAEQALGYKEIADHLEGRCGLEEAVERVRFATHQFARRQLTWLRRFREIRWIDASPGDDGKSLAPRILARFREEMEARERRKDGPGEEGERDK